MGSRRVLFVQYTNPHAYPPLEHATRALADAGWRVIVLGTHSPGQSNLLAFPPHPRVAVRLLGYVPPGWRQKAHYLGFVLWCLAWCAAWRPRAVYCSDLWSSPVGLLAAYLLRLPVVYHEHDEPALPGNRVLRGLHAARRRLARAAAVCVIPNRERLERFAAECSPRRVACVWNCPRRDEVLPPRTAPTDRVWLLYHGTIVPERVPEALVRALALLPEAIRLRVVGYETAGSAGYSGALQELAIQIGVGSRLEILPARPRSELWAVCGESHIGLALMPMQAADANLRYMVGASNKAFDYLAAEMPVLVSDLPDWRAAFIEPGYGVACDPADPASIADAVRRLTDPLGRLVAMGEAGRQRILADWNYETQFAPVARLLERLAGSPGGGN